MFFLWREEGKLRQQLFPGFRKLADSLAGRFLCSGQAFEGIGYVKDGDEVVVSALELLLRP